MDPREAHTYGKQGIDEEEGEVTYTLDTEGSETIQMEIIDEDGNPIPNAEQFFLPAMSAEEGGAVEYIVIPQQEQGEGNTATAEEEEEGEVVTTHQAVRVPHMAQEKVITFHQGDQKFYATIPQAQTQQQVINLPQTTQQVITIPQTNQKVITIQHQSTQKQPQTSASQLLPTQKSPQKWQSILPPVHVVKREIEAVEETVEPQAAVTAQIQAVNEGDDLEEGEIPMGAIRADLAKKRVSKKSKKYQYASDTDFDDDDASSAKKRRKRAVFTTSTTNCLQKALGKCVLCHFADDERLAVVSFVEDYEALIGTYKRYGCVTLDVDDLICESCIKVGTNIASSITKAKDLCQRALERQRGVYHGKTVHVQEDFAERLTRNMLDMLEKGMMCSVSVESRSTKYNVHSSILAANIKTFEDEIRAGGEMKMKSMTDDALRTMIKYFYTGELVLSGFVARQLLPYFDKWDLDWAKEKCKNVVDEEMLLTANVSLVKKRGPYKTKASQEVMKAIKREPNETDPDVSSEEIEGLDFSGNDENVPEQKADIKFPVPFKRKRGRPRTGRKARVYKETPGDCEICGKHFTRKRTMLEHMWRSHGQQPPDFDAEKQKYSPYICEHCGDLLSGKKSLKSHVRIKHPDQLPEEERTNYSCPDCGKTLGAMAQLERHRARAHSDERNHVCDTCGMTFKTRANLQAHANLMHNPRANLPCTHPGCGKYFKGKFRLRDHILRTHTAGDKRHKCSLCQYTTHYSKSLRQHYSARHNMRMSHLAAEWNQPAYKKHIFETDSSTQDKPAPYTIEPIQPDYHSQDVEVQEYFPQNAGVQSDGQPRSGYHIQRVQVVDSSQLDAILQQAHAQQQHQEEQEIEVEQETQPFEDYVEVIVSAVDSLTQ